MMKVIIAHIREEKTILIASGITMTTTTLLDIAGKIAMIPHTGLIITRNDGQPGTSLRATSA